MLTHTPFMANYYRLLLVLRLAKMFIWVISIVQQQIFRRLAMERNDVLIGGNHVLSGETKIKDHSEMEDLNMKEGVYSTN